MVKFLAYFLKKNPQLPVDRLIMCCCRL